jgi:hypothetical protein
MNFKYCLRDNKHSANNMKVLMWSAGYGWPVHGIMFFGQAKIYFLSFRLIINLGLNFNLQITGI